MGNDIQFKTLIYQNGDKYEGFCKKNKKYGFGRYTEKNGKILEGEYQLDSEIKCGCIPKKGYTQEIQSNDSLLVGFAKIYYKNGNRFQGQIKRGKRNGFGRFFNKNGQIYQGQYKDDQRHGFGKTFCVNGDVKNVLYHNGQIKFFKIQYKNGAKQSGFYQDYSIRKKFRKIYHTDGSIQQGFSDNNSNDLHKYYPAQGSFHQCFFLNNEIDQYGIIIHSNGMKYQGQVKNRQIHGFGKLQCRGGTIYQGEFVDGQIKGLGKFIFLDGRVFQGQWNFNNLLTILLTFSYHSIEQIFGTIFQDKTNNTQWDDIDQ